MRSMILSLRGAATAAATLAVAGAALVAVRQPVPAEATFACNGTQMTAAGVAAFRGISVDLLRDLRALRSLSPEEVCTIPGDKLERAVQRVREPRPDHPGEAMRYRLESLRDERGNIDPDGLTRAHRHLARMKAATGESPVAGLEPGYWTAMGPGNIGGRLRAVAIHPTDTQKIWVGSVAGGIWATTNGGAYWAPVNDFMANLAVTSIIFDPSDPNVMYAATGEGFFNADAIRGAGVFKSTNGGVGWSQLASTANSNFIFVNRLAISPNGLTLLAATSTGIWRSLDGGAVWNQSTTTRTLDVDFHPTDNSKAIAGLGSANTATFSTNGGLTFTTAITVGTSTSSSRAEVAYSRSNPLVVYASMNNSSGQIYKSTDGGATYNATPVNTGTNYLGGQGWYDNVIWVDPTDEDVLIVGGIDLWRSTNGGTTLTKISQWFSAPASAHADHHMIVEDPNFNGTTNARVYFGNDGGIYRTDNVYTVANLSGWQELNNNLQVTQFYGAGGNPSTGVVVGGTQDNGTLRFTPAGGVENWTAMFGGDGGFSASDQDDPNYFWGEYVFLNIHRSSNGGVSSSYVFSGIADANQNGSNFIAPFILDPNNQARVLAGGIRLWRTNNGRGSTPLGWTSIKPGTTSATSGSFISAIAVDQGNSDVIWVGHNNGFVYKTANGTAATPTWTAVDNNVSGTNPFPNRKVLRIAINPTDPNEVFVTFGGFNADNVWKTTNDGTSWADATGTGATGLPDVPVRSLVFNPANSAWIYAGTEVGVFASEDGGANWAVPHDGPANVSVDELFWVGQKIMAATHGRGIWSAIASATQVATVTMAAGTATVAESAGSINVGVKVLTSNTAPLTGAVTLDYATANGTASAGSDYTMRTGTLTFPAGTAHGTVLNVNVPVTADAAVEGSETFSLGISNAVGATAEPPTSTTVTILDDDSTPSISILDASGPEGNVGPGGITFPVTLSAPTANPVTVAYGTADGTAIAGSDYTSTSGTLSFAPGATSASITVPVLTDTTFEYTENFFVNLSSPTGATISDGQAEGQILNDDMAPVGTGDGLRATYYDNADFTGATVTRVDPTVDFNFAAGSPDAGIGPDTFSAIWTGAVEPRFSETYTFFVNSDEGVRLWVNDQMLIDNFANQTLTERSGVINLNSGQRYHIRLEYFEDTGNAEVHLSWSSPSVAKEIIPQSQLYSSTISVGDAVAATEGNNLSFPVTMSVASDQAVTVRYSTRSVTAGTVANFSNPAPLSIVDNGLSVPYPSVINVSGVSRPVSKVRVAFNGLTHTYISDVVFLLVGPRGQKAMLMGQAGGSTNLTAAGGINVVFDDAALIQVPVGRLDTPKAFPSGGYRPGSATTVANLPAPAPAGPYGNALSVFNGTSANGQWKLFVYDGFSGDAGAMSGGWSLVVDTAGGDYAATSGTLTFAAGETSKTVTVPTYLDGVAEGTETVALVVTAPINAGVAALGGSGVGNLELGTGDINDDVITPVASLSINDVTVTEGNAGTTTAAFTVQASQPMLVPMTVDYATQDSTATTSDGDYVATSGTLTIPAGNLSGTISVTVNGDTRPESNERYFVQLSNPINATITDGTGAGYITNDDAPNAASSTMELAHGANRVRDFSPVDGGFERVEFFRLKQAGYSSYEVVVDGISGDISTGAGPEVQLVDDDGTTVVATSSAVGTGSTRSLRWTNANASEVNDQFVRIASQGCGPSCGADDQYRVRMYETTSSVPRFNNAGSQITVLVLQNPTVNAVTGTAYFWNSAGALLGSTPVSVNARSAMVLNTSTVPGANGQSGTITVSHNGGFGGLVGKTVALEPSTGFSFDTPLLVRPR